MKRKCIYAVKYNGEPYHTTLAHTAGEAIDRTWNLKIGFLPAPLRALMTRSLLTASIAIQ